MIKIVHEDFIAHLNENENYKFLDNKNEDMRLKIALCSFITIEDEKERKKKITKKMKNDFYHFNKRRKLWEAKIGSPLLDKEIKKIKGTKVPFKPFKEGKRKEVRVNNYEIENYNFEEPEFEGYPDLKWNFKSNERLRVPISVIVAAGK